MKKIVMPKGGQTTNESVITKWRKEIGDPVNLGDVLFEIETDKATLEIESFGNGILLKRYFEAGDIVSAGSIVCVVGSADENPDEESQTKVKEERNKEKTEEIKEEQNKIKTESSQDVKTAKKSPKISQDKENHGKIMATPAARFLIKELDIDIEDVSKFVNGIIHKEDLKLYIKSLVSDTNQTQNPIQISSSPINNLESWQTTETCSSMRKTVAKRLTESVLTSPQFTVSIDVDMTNAISMRQSLKDKFPDMKISFNDIIIKCSTKAIEDFPYINGVFNYDNIILNKNVNFGLAVGTEKGLFVPVVKEVNNKSIAEISACNMANIEAVKSGNFTPDMMSNGTITLSNLGMLDTNNFTAILNPPESCILAVGKIEEKCVVRESQMKIKPIMNITATFDHRIIDGAYGAQFLKCLKNWLEEPVLLMIK